MRFHRKAIKLEELPRLNLFKKKHYLPLIQLLRLSTLLNNQRQSTTTPETLRLTTDDNHWTLRFPAGYLAQNNWCSSISNASRPTGTTSSAGSC